MASASLTGVLALVALSAVLCRATVITSDDSAPLLTEELVSAVKRSGAKWESSSDNGYLLKGATRRQVKLMMGSKKGGPVMAPRKFTEEELATAIPDSFDAATQWPNCPTIRHIRDQSACGSCWAVAASEAISDRYCVGGVNSNLEISADDLMSCCWYCGSGCEGGYPGMAWSYWVSTGLVDTACQPYPFPKCAHHQAPNTSPYPPCPSTIYPTPSCSKTCTGNGTAPFQLHKGASSYSLAGEQQYQRELMKNGPFEVAFSVYSDFVTYKGGVYVRNSTDYLGGHAVRLVGWGSLNGVKYWKIANSWNSDWGLKGYFLIIRGQNECGIEEAGSAGLAK